MLDNELFTLRHDGSLHRLTNDSDDPWAPVTIRSGEVESIYHQIATYDGDLVVVSWVETSRTVARRIDSTTWDLMSPIDVRDAKAVVNFGDETFALRSNGNMYRVIDDATQYIDDALVKVAAAVQAAWQYDQNRGLFPFRTDVWFAASTSVEAMLDVITGVSAQFASGAFLPWEPPYSFSNPPIGLHLSLAQQALHSIQLGKAHAFGPSIPGWENITTDADESYSALVQVHDSLFALRDSNDKLYEYTSADEWAEVQLPGSGQVTAMAQHGRDAFVLRGGRIYRFNGSNWQQVPWSKRFPHTPCRGQQRPLCVEERGPGVPFMTAMRSRLGPISVADAVSIGCSPTTRRNGSSVRRAMKRDSTPAVAGMTRSAWSGRTVVS